MKRTINNLVAFGSILIATQVGNAQSLLPSVSATNDIAHLDSQGILMELPETKAAQRQLQELEEERRLQLQSLQEEYRSTVERYQNEAAGLSEEENIKHAKEVQDMEIRINQAAAQLSEELKEKEATLLAPILEKAKGKIIETARELGYEYVFDSSVLLVADGKDITKEVRKKLGLK